MAATRRCQACLSSSPEAPAAALTRRECPRGSSSFAAWLLTPWVGTVTRQEAEPVRWGRGAVHTACAPKAGPRTRSRGACDCRVCDCRVCDRRACAWHARGCRSCGSAGPPAFQYDCFSFYQLKTGWREDRNPLVPGGGVKTSSPCTEDPAPPARPAAGWQKQPPDGVDVVSPFLAQGI